MFRNFKIQNIVSAVHCNFKIDLADLADKVNGFCSYEPNLFPGLMYRVRMNNGTDVAPEQPRAKRTKTRSKTGSHNLIVFLCFTSGKIVITGGRSRSQVLTAWRNFFTNILTTYKTQNDYGSSGNYRLWQMVARSQQSELSKVRDLSMSLTITLPPLLQSIVQQYPNTIDHNDQIEEIMDEWARNDVLEFQEAASVNDTGKVPTRLTDILRACDNVSIDMLFTREIKNRNRMVEYINNLNPIESIDLSNPSTFKPITVWK